MRIPLNPDDQARAQGLGRLSFQSLSGILGLFQKSDHPSVILSSLP